MSNGKNNLTCSDAFGKMCADIRAIARELGFGTLWFPCKANPSITFEVHNGLITQVELTFTQNGQPDRKKRYRAD